MNRKATTAHGIRAIQYRRWLAESGPLLIAIFIRMCALAPALMIVVIGFVTLVIGLLCIAFVVQERDDDDDDDE